MSGEFVSCGTVIDGQTCVLPRGHGPVHEDRMGVRFPVPTEVTPAKFPEPCGVEWGTGWGTFRCQKDKGHDADPSDVHARVHRSRLDSTYDAVTDEARVF